MGLSMAPCTPTSASFRGFEGRGDSSDPSRINDEDYRSGSNLSVPPSGGPILCLRQNARAHIGSDTMESANNYPADRLEHT
jgi:hypothetical protein